jgi:hypothetical protein
MKMIDQEIHEIEQRMARRRHELADTARAAKARATRRIASPAGLVTAGVLGFVATVVLMRRRRMTPVYVQANKVKGGAAVSVLGMLMPVALSLVRAQIGAQFGGPAGLAQYVLSKVKGRPSSPGDVRVAPRGATPVAPRTVHPAR